MPRAVLTRDAAKDAAGRARLEIEFKHLCEIADESAPLRTSLARLDAKLADPSLAEHPKRQAAAERREAMAAELAELKGRAHAVMTRAAETWDGMSADGRPDEYGAPNGIGHALGLWREAVESVAERRKEREAYMALVRGNTGPVPF